MKTGTSEQKSDGKKGSKTDIKRKKGTLSADTLPVLVDYFACLCVCLERERERDVPSSEDVCVFQRPFGQVESSFPCDEPGGALGDHRYILFQTHRLS